jgi:hypothetical protein
LNSGGATTNLSGAIGNTSAATRLASLTVNSTGDSNIGGSISTTTDIGSPIGTPTGDITFAGRPVVNAAVTFTSYASTSPLTAGGNITVHDIIGSYSLTLVVSTVAANNRAIKLEGTAAQAVSLSGGVFTVTGYNVTRTAATALNITAPTFAISLNTNVNPPAALTVNGATTNRGTINAAALAAGSDAIIFYGNYNGNNGGGALNIGTINGASTSGTDYGPNPNIVFRGATVTLGIFNHRGDVAVFNGASGSSHALSQPADPLVVFASHHTPGAVIIQPGNTVTLGSHIYQDTFANTAVGATEGVKSLTLATLGTLGGRLVIGSTYNWIMGDNAGPASGYTPAFASGFYGYHGELFMGTGSELSTRDFYTEINNLPTNEHTVWPTGVSTITASGNVYINETFSGLLTNSTIIMNGTFVASTSGLIKVRTTGTPVKIGNLVVGDGIATHSAAVDSNLIIQGDLTIIPPVSPLVTTLYGGQTAASAWHIQVFGNWIQSRSSTSPGYELTTLPEDNDGRGIFTSQRSAVEFGDHSLSGGVYKIVGWTTFYELVCYEQLATLQFSNFPHQHTVGQKFSVFPSTAPYPADFVNDRIAAEGSMMIMTRLIGYDPSMTPPVTAGSEAPQFGSSPYAVPPTASDIPSPPPAPLSPHWSRDFWYFELASGGELEVNWTSIYYSFSTRRLPLPPGLDSSWRVDAEPYMEIGTPALGLPPPPQYPDPGSGSYYNVNWYVGNKFYYGFTEDYNGNGRIDRLRLQAAFELKDSASGAFVGFRVEVWDDQGTYYTVLGYERADTQTLNGVADASATSKRDCIYVFLREMPYSDGNKRLHWRIVSNQNLRDLTTGTVPISEAGDTDKNIITGYANLTGCWDTVPPRINYALTVPDSERNEIYFQMSEPVDISGINTSTGIQLDPVVDAGVHSAGGLPKAGSSLAALDTSQFKFSIDSSFDLEDLSDPTLPEFRLLNAQVTPPSPSVPTWSIRDFAEDAFDLRNSGVQYAYRFPTPKYPVDYNYSAYVSVLNKDHAGALPAPSVLIPNGAVDLSSTPPLQPSTLSHRVTDALISVPPSGTDARYFIWPVFARFLIPPNPGASFPSISGFPGTQDSDTGIIYDFTGRRALEDRDVLLQARLNPRTGITGPLLYFGLNVPLVYRYPAVNNNNGRGSGGLWMPHPLPPPPSTAPYVNLVPTYYTAPAPLSDLSPAHPLYNFTFLKEYYNSVSRLDFLFRLPGTAPDVFAVRLDMVPGSIPADWYHRLRPWSFDIHDVRLQRGGVTILNNVINPEHGEKVQIRYHIVNGGRVTVQVFTLDGNMIKVLYRGQREVGEYTEVWDGRNNGGRSVARGMYFVRVVGPDIDEIRKIMVVK